jgi:hypothetical protein
MLDGPDCSKEFNEGMGSLMWSREKTGWAKKGQTRTTNEWGKSQKKDQCEWSGGTKRPIQISTLVMMVLCPSKNKLNNSVATAGIDLPNGIVMPLIALITSCYSRDIFRSSDWCMNAVIEIGALSLKEKWLLVDIDI